MMMMIFWFGMFTAPATCLPYTFCLLLYPPPFFFCFFLYRSTLLTFLLVTCFDAIYATCNMPLVAVVPSAMLFTATDHLLLFLATRILPSRIYRTFDACVRWFNTCMPRYTTRTHTSTRARHAYRVYLRRACWITPRVDSIFGVLLRAARIRLPISTACHGCVYLLPHRRPLVLTWRDASRLALRCLRARAALRCCRLRTAPRYALHRLRHRCYAVAYLLTYAPALLLPFRTIVCAFNSGCARI